MPNGASRRTNASTTRYSNNTAASTRLKSHTNHIINTHLKLQASHRHNAPSAGLAVPSAELTPRLAPCFSDQLASKSRSIR